LLGAGCLIVVSLVGVGLHQLHKPMHVASAPTQATALQTRQLRFVDLGDGVAVYGGHVRVFDAASGVELPPLADKEGFVRAVLNSLAFERHKRGVAGDAGFALNFWSDNRITLTDLASGASVSVGQFGAGNKAAFLRFFDQPKAAP
jgi:putative photosynthetic complex assembly protein